MKFRNDINALRCAAVLMVVLFHFKVSYFDTGFVGVDVFFAISGYLMTSILMGSKGTFLETLFGFYVARARRIVPALAAMSVVLVLVGWWLLDPFAYKDLGKEIRQAAFFRSNFHFWKESGYFEAAAYDKWLLHSWSLSVEWQFYLIYPLLLGALHKFGATPANIRRVLWGITGASLAFALLGKVDNAFCYYLLPTRAWEMTAGGIAFLYRRDNPSPRWAGGMAAVAWSAVLLSGLLLPPSARWPNAWAVIPVLATALLLWLAHPQRWQENPVVAALGRWSYSIYLWHWPLIVFFRYWFERPPNPYEVVLLIAASIAAGALSYRFVEVRMMRLPVWGVARRRVGAAVALLVVGWIAGSIGVVGSDAALRVGDRVAAARKDATLSVGAVLECQDIRVGEMPACRYGQGPLKAIVLGDSHSKTMVPGIMAETGGAVINIAMNSCPTVYRSDNPECNQFTEKAILAIRAADLGVPVIVANRMALYRYGHTVEKPSSVPPTAYADHSASNDAKDEEYLRAYSDSLCKINESAPVYAMYPVPEFSVMVPKAMTKRIMLTPEDSDVSVPRSAYLARNELAIKAIDHAAKTCGIHVIDPTPYLCNTTLCFGTDKRRSLYYDENHLSPYGSEFIRHAFQPLKS